MITNQRQKTIAIFLTLNFLTTLFPINILFASNNGPTAPEAASFEPVDATDMVNLATGDLSYVLPLLNVPSPEGGYPVALAYHAGIAMDQEASWVGLGWNLNPGSINRGVNGVPDDWGKTKYSEFFYDQGWTEDYYNFGIGATFNGSVSVGLGLSWGSNQSLGGYVSASVGLQKGASIGGSIGTNGSSINGGVAGANFSFGTSGVGIGYGPGNDKNTSLGLNLNYSYNSGLSGGIDVRQKNGTFGKSGDTKSLGINLSSKGVSANAKVNGYGAGISSSNYSISSGDYDISVSSKGFFIPAYIFYINYSHTQVKYSLFKYNNLNTSGILYPIESNTLRPYDNSSLLSRSLNENNIMDTNIIAKYDDSVADSEYLENTYHLDKNNLVLPNYDNYAVTAQGLSGNLRPYFYSELNLSARGRGSQNNDYIYVAYLNHDVSEYNSAISSGVDVNRDAVKKINFTMDNAYNSFLRVATTDISNPLSDNNISDNTVLANVETLDANSFDNTNSLTPEYFSKKREGNYIETFTNKEIRDSYNNGISTISGFIDAKELDRNDTKTFLDEGIGAYKITAIDGKTYHYSLPVYNFESFYKSFNVDEGDPVDEDTNFFEIIKDTPYATHWLLTGVTGADYIDINNNGKMDEDDYGYWVEFDYGKWSDGYLWQTPNGRYDIEENKGGDKTYSYSWGRKQLYYLDAIKTRTHTALFVKDIRQDSKSESMVEYNEKWTSGEFSNSNSPFELESHSAYLSQEDEKRFTFPGETFYNRFSYKSVLPDYNECEIDFYRGIMNVGKYVDIPKSSSMYLKQILLIKNDVLTYSKRSNPGSTGLNGLISTNVAYSSVSAMNDEFRCGPWPILYSKPPEVKQFKVDIEDNVLDVKDIEGLNLEANAQQIISFDQDYSLAPNSPNSDAPNSGRLTLKQVNFKGKQGVQVIPPYKFSYLNEALPFDSDNIDDWGYANTNPERWSLNEITTPVGGKIKILYEADSYYTEAASPEKRTFVVDNVVRNGTEFRLNIALANNLQSYFEIGRRHQLDYRVKTYTENQDGQSFSQTTEYLSGVYEVVAVGSNYVTVVDTALFQGYLEGFDNNQGCGPFVNGEEICVENLRVFGLAFDYRSSGDSNGREGGGLRVANIEVTDGISSLQTSYEYTEPGTNNISGVTSYAPSDDEQKVIPYVSELPPPMVIYEHVKMVNRDGNGNIAGSTAFQFETLKTTFKDPGYLFSLGDAFKVQENQNQEFNGGKVIANKYTIYSSLANIGRLLSVSAYNAEDQILSENNNVYKENLDQDQEIGVTQESFKSLKRVQKTSNFDEYFYVSSTSKVSYPSVLDSKISTQGGFTNTTSYTAHDFLTGQSLEVEARNSSNQIIRTSTIPAYTIPQYGAMGSKIDNPDYKNMLTQPSMVVSDISVAGNGNYNSFAASVITWNDKTYYNDENLITDDGIWRRHQSYSWDGNLASDGTFGELVDQNDFNWDSNAQNNTWKKNSETTRYNHFSVPLEIVDINQNKASTKMGYDNTKTLAVGNAGYNELFYSGAEDLKGTSFGGDVAKGTATQITSDSHTGLSALQLTSGQTAFVVNVEEGKRDAYKASVWAKYESHQNVRLNVAGATVTYNADEVVRAGDWVQLNFYFNINGTQTVHVAASGGSAIVDDFRVHPLASSMTSYVYNEWDELTHIIRANNMATQYEYDQAGRLINSFAEVADFNGAGSGGFKRVSQNSYTYKN